MNEPVFLNGVPVVGFGAATTAPPITPRMASPWTVAIATSVVGAAATWALEEFAHKVRGTRR